MFEAFDRAGKLRAICGGGRYDRLLGTLGGENVPMVGFGFGDAVIVELLKEKKLLPELAHAVDDVVVCMDPDLRADACGIAGKFVFRCLCYHSHAWDARLLLCSSSCWY